MKCWQCGASLPDPEFKKIGFRAECEKCGASLHCCQNCRYYHKGLPNDCEVPGTEFIFDRSKMNLCEDFRLRAENTGKADVDLSDVESRLFGDAQQEGKPKLTPKNKFDSLFKGDL